MNWLEVSLTVSGEAAEAVADVLTRFAPSGVAIEASQIDSTASDEGLPVGPVIVRAYLPADSALEGVRAQMEEALWHLGQLLPLPQPEYRPVAEADWAEAWKVNYQPIRVGKHLLIVPAWLNPPLEPADVPIRLDPGMAFGTGTHPTTQLCLAAIEKHLRPGQAMLDLGTGSGILAIAAALLQTRQGAPLPGSVWAVDIDPEAVRVAGDNAAANGVAEMIRLDEGSLEIVLAAGYNAPLVVANILARILVEMLTDGLGQTVAPGGLLVLSGILASQAFEVVAALKAAGLELAAEEKIEDWVALIGRKPAGPQA